MKVSLPENDDERQKMASDKSMNDSRMMQQLISAGSDFNERPQDEGYRPYVSPRDRAIAEGERDSGGDARVAEEAGQFGEPGTSRIVKPTAKPAAKPTPKPVAKPTPKPAAKAATDTGDESARLAARYAKPALRQETMRERAESYNRKRAAQKAEDAAKDTTPRGQGRILTGIKKKADENKFMGSTGLKSGGSVGSASRRADGIATKGKTRGRYI